VTYRDHEADDRPYDGPYEDDWDDRWEDGAHDVGTRDHAFHPADDDLWIEEGEVLAEPVPRRRGAPPPRRGERRGQRRRPGQTGGVPVVATTLDEGGGRGADDRYDDDHYENLPPDKLPRWVLVLGVFVLVIGVLVGSGMWWYQRQVDPPGGPGDPVEVEIPRGASASGLGGRLAGNGVVTNAMLFNFWAQRKGLGTVEAGVYTFRTNMSFDEARAVIEGGPTRQLDATGDQVKVLIPEGLTIEQIRTRVTDTVPRFTEDALVDALTSGAVRSSLRPKDAEATPRSWEGLLFPATYDVGPKTTAVEFLNTLASTMESRVANLDPEASVAAINERYGLDLGVYDVLVVASLVQAEAGGAQEAARIASVIYNRLEKQSTAYPLGIDASDEYGADLEGMTPAQYRETDGAYNLRKRAELPPTPIAAPGDYALEGAFAPEDTEYMYYVLVQEGVHTFVVTDAEFQQAKRQCQQAGLCG